MGIKSMWNWISYIVCNRSDPKKDPENEKLIEHTKDIEYGSVVKFSHHHDFQPAIKQSRQLLDGNGSYNIYVIDPCIDKKQ